MLFKLNLQNPMTYREADIVPSDADGLEIGGELCFCCSFRYEDVIFSLTPLWSGERAPLSKEEKDLIEAGLLAPEREGYNRQIPPGRYLMLQTVPSDDMDEIRKAARSLAGGYREGLIYVRFFKENVLETVMQLFTAEQ